MTATDIASRLSGDRISIADSAPRLREGPPALAEPPTDATADVDSADAFIAGTSRDNMSMVERVAKVVSGISAIGVARNALLAAGWAATISANRIMVGEDVLAQFIPVKAGTTGQIDARWVVYSIAGAHPVWVVGAESPQHSDASIG